MLTCYEIAKATSGFISTEGALRLPTTYDNHPSNPIQSPPSIQASTYSSEDDLSIEDII